MPNLFKFGAYSIYFWSNESSEPIHVHVSIKRANKLSVKFWLLKNGDVSLAYNHAGFSKREINGLKEFIKTNYSFIIERWKEYFQVKDVKFYN